MGGDIEDHTARDLAALYSYSADRVQLNEVDETTVLAVGFATDGSGRATGHMANICKTAGSWGAMRVVFGMSGRPVSQQTVLRTIDDLDALVRWLRGDA